MKCNKTQGKWCKNKHGASKIIDMFETYQLPPPVLSEDLGVDKKRKRVEEFASSSNSAQRIVAEEAPGLEGGVELFDLLDS
jgi:hypothetical protein